MPHEDLHATATKALSGAKETHGLPTYFHHDPDTAGLVGKGGSDLMQAAKDAKAAGDTGKVGKIYNLISAKTALISGTALPKPHPAFGATGAAMLPAYLVADKDITHVANVSGGDLNNVIQDAFVAGKDALGKKMAHLGEVKQAIENNQPVHAKPTDYNVNTGAKPGIFGKIVSAFGGLFGKK